jgi:amino acid adenylation domain-containing protein
VSSSSALTPAQHAVWVATMIDPDTASDYHLGWTTRFAANHDCAQVVIAIERTLSAPECLSEVVVVDGDGEPQWSTGSVRGEVATVDLRDEPDPETTVLDRVDRLRRRIGTLSDGPLHQHELLVLPDGYVWAQAYHHILVDGRSIHELTRRVVADLHGGPESLADRVTTGPIAQGTDEYWERTAASLAGTDDGLLERPARTVGSTSRELDSDTVHSIAALAERTGLRLGRVTAGLLSAYTATLRGPGPHAVRLAVAGAGPRREIGMRSALVPVVSTTDHGTTVIDYLRSFDAALTEGRPHHGVEPEALSRALRARFGAAILTAPGINVMLDGPTASDGTVRSVWVGPSTDIEFLAEGEIGDGRLRITVRGRADVDEIAANTAAVVAFLSSAVQAPDTPLDRLRLVDDHERRRLLASHNDTGRCVADTDVVGMIFANAERTPAATAVIDGDRTLDYRTLVGAATRIARVLRDKFPVTTESVVAVDMLRSAEMTAALLGIMTAGAAFVPLDPAWPEKRRDAVLVDAGVVAVVAGPGAGPRTGLPTHVVDLTETEQPAVVAERDPESLAYVIFTSGSSGRPKGAMIRHGAIASRMRWQIENVLHFGADDASLFKAPLSFDISINEVLLPLCSGGQVVVARDGEEREPERLLHLIGEHGVTFTYLVASMLDVLLDTDADHTEPRLRELRHVWCGGELLTPELFRRFRTQLSGATMYHGYGPAEATIGVSHIVYRGEAVRNSTSIGRPNPGCRLYVLDRALRPVPSGMGGELYAAGDLLGRGYVEAPALTSVRFVANPFHDIGDPASTPRLYRTGDRARWVGDELEFLGRVDHQVKIGGMRVELEEIEKTIAASAGVRACVVIIRNSRVYGYLVPESSAAGDTTEVVAAAMRHAEQNLPKHMVPAWLTTLAELPTTANGKVDRRALPEPQTEPASGGPLTPDQHPIAAAFAETLGIDVTNVGPATGFFTSGGDSLAAIRLANRLSRLFGKVVPSRAVFDRPTVAELTDFVSHADAATAPVAAVADTDGPSESSPTPGQRRMWLASQLDTGTATYTVPIAFRFESEPDRETLEAALADTLRRHPALRTLLVARGSALTAHRLPVGDPRSRPRLEAAADADEFVRRPFDLASEAPLRAALVREAGGWLFVVAIHHSATDEASEPVLLATIEDAVRERRAGRVPQWNDTVFDLSEPTGEDADAALRRLGPLPDTADIPGWRTLPAGFGRPGATITRTLRGTAADDVRRRCAEGNSTVFEAALDSVAIAVRRIGGPSRLLIAAPVARTTPEDGIVGCNVATTLFASCSDSGLRDQVASTLDAKADVADLVSAAPELRDRAAPRIMVVHQSRRLDRIVIGDDVGIRTQLTTGTAKFDATITVAEAENDLIVDLEYAADAVPAAEADRFLRQVCSVLRGECPLDAADTATVDLLNGPPAISNTVTVIDLLEPVASVEAHRVANALAAAHVGPGTVVAVRAARSRRQVDLLHGVVLAGAAYVPVDPAWPTARQETVIADAGAAYVVGDGGDLGGARHLDIGASSLSAAPVRPRPDHAAYVLFTSGSTGRPKGVVVSHRAIANRLLAATDLHGLTADDVILYKTPFTFDVSLWELFVPAIIGARQAIAPPEAHRHPSALASAIIDAEASVVHFVPSMLAAFTEYLAASPDTTRAVARTLRLVVCSGEALTAEHVRRFADMLPGVRIDNLYGPTEAAVDVTASVDVTVGEPVGIGFPLPGVRCRILDERMCPVIPGAVGDLYLTGVQLARGYAGRPGITAERFVADPFGSGDRMYDTGDRARQRPDGSIDYQGRRDDQVKIGGQRIELGDVEAALTAAPGVESAAAFVTDGALSAVYVGDVSPATVRSHAATLVPSALVPARLTSVQALPLTAHGKLDRVGAATLGAAPTVTAGRAPEGPVETALSTAFAEALGISSAPADVDFFALGGDSISGIAVVTVAQRHGLDLTVVDLFEARTVEALAGRCAPPPDTSLQAPPAEEPVSLPAVAASAKREGTELDAMTLEAPLDIDDTEAAMRALATVSDARPELRVRVDRRRARLWRAFQLTEIPHGADVDVSAGRLAAIETRGGRPVLVVHRMALPDDEQEGLRVLAGELQAAADRADRGL